MQEKVKPLLLILAGPTAVGKTSTAVQLAKELSTAIINCDSRQVYSEMIIGTAMPNAVERSLVHHYFFGDRSVSEEYNASMFEADVISFLEDWFEKNNCVIMAGGSGLYIDAVCRGIDDLPSIESNIRQKLKDEYNHQGHSAMLARLKSADPEYYKIVDINNPRRILKALEVFEMTGRTYSSYLTRIPKERPFRVNMIGLDRPRSELHERINQRVDAMMEAGLLEEAESLLPYRHMNALNTVGYRELFEYFDGKKTLGEAVDNIKAHTRQYARRQLTWLRRYPEIKWFHPDDFEMILQFVKYL